MFTTFIEVKELMEMNEDGSESHETCREKLILTLISVVNRLRRNK